jgi:hypothetical protein
MRVIAILPGRYHPVHPGHVQAFKYMANIFGIANTFLGMSEKQDPPRSPFSIEDRVRIALCAGIPRKNIIPVHYPYSSKEYLDKFRSDQNNTVIVYGIGAKDMAEKPRFTFESDSLIQPYPKDGMNLKPASQATYLVTTPTMPFKIGNQTIENARNIRSMYGKATDQQRINILQELYGKYAELVKPIFDKNIRLNESAMHYHFNMLIENGMKLYPHINEDKQRKLLIMLDEAKNLAQQAAIAINMKKSGKKPKK